MKRIVLLCTALLLMFSLGACFSNQYLQKDELAALISDHRELFVAAAKEAQTLSDSAYISTIGYYKPSGAPENLSGLYVYDTEKKETRALESEPITALFETCGVHSLGIRTQNGQYACEFSIGGSNRIYNGIYYADPDKPLFLNDYAITLAPDGAGYSYVVEKMNYYTEKIEDRFYYYAAQAS